MNSVFANGESTAQVARLRQFLAWLIPTAIGFALLETVVFLVAPIQAIGMAALITSSYLGCLLGAQYFLRRGAIVPAVGLICGGLLAVDPLIVAIWPSVLPALAVLPVVAVAIALPYLDRTAMYRLLGISLGVAIVVALLGTYATPIARPPNWLDDLLQISTLVMITVLALVLMEQFRSRLSETLTAMQSAQQRLEAQHERLAVTLESIGDGVLTTDAYGMILTLNHTMERFTGWAQAEALGKQLTEILVLVNASDRGSRSQLIEPIFQNPSASLAIPESLLVARDETERYVSGTAVALHEHGGTVVGFVLAFHDISNQKQAQEDRLNWERQILEGQKLESLGVLAGGIAHDFNNLLTGILGNASLALTEVDPNSSVHYGLGQIEIAATRAAELTRQMLAYAGKGRIVKQAIDLNDLIIEMAALLKVSIGKQVALQFDLAARLPLFEGDATQIRQIVMNLIMNAAEAIGSTHGSITIKTQPRHFPSAHELPTNTDREEPLSGEYVMLEVTDTGSGMDAATLARMFEPFFTTKFTGRGLGLAAVLGIIRAHGGHLQVTSEIGTGTTFSILLPGALESLGLMSLPTAHLGKIRQSATILIVDDDSVARDAIVAMLHHHAFTVITASDGLEAIAAYMAHHATIDCVLLDLIMPRMNGMEALQHIRQMTPNVPVVLMSGYSEPDVLHQLPQLPLVGFLQKPFTLQLLLEALNPFLSPRA